MTQKEIQIHLASHLPEGNFASSNDLIDTSLGRTTRLCMCFRLGDEKITSQGHGEKGAAATKFIA